MRGLGIGMIVTALVMGIGSSQKGTANNNVASQPDGTGTSQAVVLSDLKDTQNQGPGDSEPSETTETTESKEPSGTEEGSEPSETAEATKSKEPSGTEEGSEPSETTETTESKEPSKTPEDSGTQQDAEAAGQTQVPDGASGSASETEGEVVTFRIENGNGSETVSKKLEEAGLVENASSFNKFLCDNGYSKSIRAGEYEIPVGAGEEEIAEIITRRR